ncbi:DUF1330 domain-containing protein [Lentzea sp. HUAS12]|uniref:DUF1330 domain-containing protein n=1 Tax=Lentzea sp. HUAS12 TaxID=2951806 RepID=UPI0020A1316C|nr:DUF1330 domain-containing protein [Lentzea sp. HUAS12]USX56276.1 DUF1330 domain-containing protein [Lentzea sp. HUAS12]
MTALLIGNVGPVADHEGMAAYRERVGRILEAHGGRFVIRGGEFTVLEGAWWPTHLSVMEFPTADHARRWYTSPEYRELLSLREGTPMDLVLVEGP